MVRPPEASFVHQARAAFEYSLNNFMWKQAMFFAERLCAECPTEEFSYLLALAFFHNQEHSRARALLQGNRLPEARYLLAKCCFHLQRWDEADEALVSNSATSNLSDVVHGAMGLFLLGQVKERQAQQERALECYAKCLELCPLMWEAYERWSWLVLGSLSSSRSFTANMATSTFTDDKLSQSATGLASLSAVGGFFAANGTSARSQSEALRPETATPHSAGRSPTARGEHLSARGSRRSEHTRGGGAVHHTNSHGSQSTRSSRGNTEAREEAAQRRLQAALAADGTAGADSNATASDTTLAQLLCKLGLSVHAIHGFECNQALQLLGTVPERHHKTGYVLDLVGMCHFESADYRKAEQFYKQVYRNEPHRVEGLEHYSTTLWHLREDIELGALAQQVLQSNRLKPQVWCVVGNCFSLQKEHDTAIKFFKRAIQLDPSFTYAYTLCGHEFVTNEKFDKAIPMFEQALKIDPRHYNAWWGLGNIYHRQEEHENAKYHFIKALEINRNNSVLRCYLGMVFDSLDNRSLALENFEKASQGEPQNGMAYFHKACVLMGLERYEEALVDLQKVHQLAPKEACVHFQMGKAYQKQRQDRKALLHFNMALDLNSRDSKDYHTIKTHIERLQIRNIRDTETPGAAALQPPPNAGALAF